MKELTMKTFCRTCNNQECIKHGRSIRFSWECGRYKKIVNYNRIMNADSIAELVDVLSEGFEKCNENGIINKEKLKEWINESHE